MWKKSTAVKQSHWMNLFIVVFCLNGLLPKSMSKLVHSRCKLTCKLFNKIIRLLTSMKTNNWVSVFMLLGSRVGAVVRAFAFHQCVPGSIPGPGVICGLIVGSLLCYERFFSRYFGFPLSSKSNI